MLVVDGKIPVSLLTCPMLHLSRAPLRWNLIPNARERENISLVCLLNETSTGVVRMFVFRPLDISRTAHRLKEGDPWLRNGVPLFNLDQFCDVVRSLAGRKSYAIKGNSRPLTSTNPLLSSHTFAAFQL
jgi:hypothetical protein